MRTNWVLILSLVVLVIIIGVIVYLGTPGLQLARKQERTPRLLQAWVLSQVGDTPYATTEPKMVAPGEKIHLYALIKAEDLETHDTFFVTTAPKVQLYGKPIPANQIRTWDPEQWLDISLFWYRIDGMQDESGALKFQATYLSDWQTGTWDRLLTPDDLKPVGVPYHEEPVGTMRFALEARIPKPDGETLYETKSAGVNELQRDPTTRAVHRIIVAPSGHYGEVARAYYNVPYVKGDVPASWVRNFAALHPFALPLAAYELKHGMELPNLTLDQYDRITETQVAEAHCDVESALCFQTRVRRGRRRADAIKFGAEVAPGDILFALDRACLVMEDSGPDDQPNGELDLADWIICGFPEDKPPYPMVQRMSSGFPAPQFEIRRFRAPQP